MALPAVLGLIGKHSSGGASGVASLLSSQKDNIAAAVPSGLNLGSVLSGWGGTTATAATGAAAEVSHHAAAVTETAGGGGGSNEVFITLIPAGCPCRRCMVYLGRQWRKR